MKIIPYPANAKLHPKKQIDLLAKVVMEVGWRQNTEVNQSGIIVAGHGRWMVWEAYKDNPKMPPIWITDDKGNTIHGKHDDRPLTDEQEKMWRLADNQLNAMTDIDMGLVLDELKGLSDEMFDLTGFDKDLLIEPDEKDDVIPENPPTVAQKGDLWQLGRHRLHCADSCDSGAVLKLCDGNRAQMCFTDPPYNVNYTGGMGTHEKNDREGIQNDNMSKESFREFLINAMKPIVANTDGGIYVCMSSSELASLREAFESAGGHWQSFIVWVKNNFTLSRADYQNTYEPILYGWRDGIVNHYFTQRRDIANVWEDLSKVKTEYDGKETTITFQGFKVKIQGKVEKGEVIRKKQHMDIWRHDKPTVSKLHPTMKPVALVVEAITNSSNAGDIVLDTFAGGGSTLIACEKTGRICYSQELDPKFVDVIIKRWEDYTGQKAIKVV